MSVTKINTMAQQNKELAEELTVCLMIDKIRNNKRPYNGWHKDSFESDCADFFLEGYEAAERGETLLDGFHECFKRGHAAYQSVIG